MEVFKNYDLSSYNTFAVSVQAKTFILIDSIEELTTLNQEPYLLLGGGSNLLFIENLIKFPVVKIRYNYNKTTKQQNNNIIMRVSAGINWHTLVTHCVENGWSGIENLALIPGTVGAAPVQNIGAYGVEIKDFITKVQVFDRMKNQTYSLANEQCNFAYRDSIFKQNPGRYVITEIELSLSRQPKLNLNYQGLREYLNAQNIANPTISDVYHAVIAIRNTKLPNPQFLGNAGSFFKNPIISKEELILLKEKFPDIPAFGYNPAYVKLSAAWLIEACGLKGKRWGKIGISDKHALVIVNYGEKDGIQIKQVSDLICETVLSKFGIVLTPEVNIIDNSWKPAFMS